MTIQLVNIEFQTMNVNKGPAAAAPQRVQAELSSKQRDPNPYKNNP